MVDAARLMVVVESDTRDLTSGLQKAHGLVESFGSGVTGALGKVASAAAAPIKALGAIGLAAGGLNALTGAAGSLAGVFGVGLNSSMEQVRAQLTAMTKDGGAAEKILKDIRTEADKTPFAFDEMAKATASLLPSAKSSGVALMDLVRQAEILAASNPAQGLEGAAVALREAVSGDFTSVIERFNLPRQRINELVKQGVPGLKAVSTAMKEMGLDASLVTGLANTFTGRWSTFQDTLSGFSATLGAGLFDALKEGLGAAQTALDQNKDAIAGFVSTAGAAIGKFVGDAIPRLIALGQQVIPQLIAAFGRVRDTVGPLVERLTTFFSSLTSGATLATTVNRAFGDLIPAGLNPILDAVDRAFVAVRDTVASLVSTIQGGGLAGLWAAVQAAMSDFGPTGERVASVLTAIATAVGTLVPQPIKDFVTSLVASAQAAGDGESPMKTLATAVNAVTGAIEEAITFLKQNEIVLYAVAGAATAMTLAYLAGQGLRLATQAVTLATQAYTTAQWLLNAALTANPIGIVVVALGALAGALIYAYTHSEIFREFIDTAFTVLKTVAVAAIKIVETWLSRLGDDLETIGRVMMTLAQTASTVFSSIVLTVQTAWAQISEATTSTFAAVLKTATETWDSVSSAIGDAVAAARTAVETRLGQIAGLFESARSTIAGIVAGIRAVVEEAFGAAVSVAQSAQATIGGVLETVKGWAKTIMGIIDAVRDAISHLPSAPSAPSGGGGGGPVATAQALIGRAPVTVQVNLPAGAYIGSVGEFARILSPELERLVAVRTVI